jgi:hypothetical protein
MPIARCASCGAPNRKGNAYGVAVIPVGYPDCAIVCSVPGCENPALIWLTAWETAEFNGGRRIFNLSGRSPKVRLAEPRSHVASDEPSPFCSMPVHAG